MKFDKHLNFWLFYVYFFVVIDIYGTLIKINFDSTGGNTCSATSNIPEDIHYESWPPNIIKDTFNLSFSVGPTGGERGLKSVTGHALSGVVWWVNDMMLPEIYVERGRTYYLTVEGGNDEIYRRPLYVTNDPNGGFYLKPNFEQDEKTYAGIIKGASGSILTFGRLAGRLCEWKDPTGDSWRESETFEEYRKKLHKTCEKGEPGIVVWTVEEDTPHTVYYQSAMEKNIGWKFHVVDRKPPTEFSSYCMNILTGIYNEIQELKKQMSTLQIN